MKKYSLIGWITAIWGLLGVLYILGKAVVRVGPIVMDAIQSGLSPWQWGITLVWLLFMGYTEAFKGFQKAFSPRVGARIRWLREHPGFFRTLLAPFFCMGYFGASRKRTLVSVILTTGIVLIVVLVKGMSQPWRGIIDAGVVLGLSWGFITALWFSLQALFTQKETVGPELSQYFERKTQTE